MAKKAKKASKSSAKSGGKSAKKKSAGKKARANGRSANGSSRAPDAIALLKQDHRTVETLFEEFENAKGGNAKQRLAQQICMELMVHAQIEEEIFYPAVKDAVEEDIYTEAQVEHDGAKMLIAEIMEGDPDDEFYSANVKVLSEMIKHHVKEEEQRDGMFAQAKESDIDMGALGQQLMQRKEDLLRLYKRNGLPAPETRTQKGAKVRRGQPVEGNAYA